MDYALSYMSLFCKFSQCTMHDDHGRLYPSSQSRHRLRRHIAALWPVRVVNQSFVTVILVVAVFLHSLPMVAEGKLRAEREPVLTTYFPTSVCQWIITHASRWINNKGLPFESTSQVVQKGGSQSEIALKRVTSYEGSGLRAPHGFQLSTATHT